VSGDRQTTAPLRAVQCKRPNDYVPGWAYGIPEISFAVKVIEFIASRLPEYFTDIEKMYAVARSQGDTAQVFLRKNLHLP
jgi:hypothetical protein